MSVSNLKKKNGAIAGGYKMVMVFGKKINMMFESQLKLHATAFGKRSYWFERFNLIGCPDLNKGKIKWTTETKSLLPTASCTLPTTHPIWSLFYFQTDYINKGYWVRLLLTM